jgi:hypothetical protein
MTLALKVSIVAAAAGWTSALVAVWNARRSHQSAVSAEDGMA